MMRISWVFALAVVISACSGRVNQLNGGESFGYAPEATIADQDTLVAAAIHGGSVCQIPDFYCAGGKICVQGNCAENPCVSSPECPSPDLPCRAACVAVADRCAGVTCTGGETCVDGHCITGCFPMPCAGVSCEEGYYCAGGKCQALFSGGLASQVNCPEGYAATLQVCAENPCAGVDCGLGSSCLGGQCVANPCAGVTCNPGELCANGSCVDSCSIGTGSGSGDVGGSGGTGDSGGSGDSGGGEEPECVPDCVQKGCGEANGCGSVCRGCAESQRCVPEGTTWLCCQPDCEGKLCGDDNGCGGKCDGPCPAGQSCNDGTCTVDSPQSCPCGEQYVAGQCVPLCGADQSLCGCTACCATGMPCDYSTGTCVTID